jgi:hypothetical protein
LSLLTLLRAAAIIGGFIWGIYIIAGWYSFSLVYSYGLKSFDFLGLTNKAVEILLVQTLADVVLLLFGFFGGSSKTTNNDRIIYVHRNQSEESPYFEPFIASTDNNRVNYVRNQSENLNHPEQFVDVTDSRQCPHCAETIKAAARICRFCKLKVDQRAGFSSN